VDSNVRYFNQASQPIYVSCKYSNDRVFRQETAITAKRDDFARKKKKIKESTVEKLYTTSVVA